MIRVKLIAYALLAFVTISCSSKTGCLVADSLQEMQSEVLRDEGLHLFLRTTGFNEKEFFYELYKESPAFDECGQSEKKPISQAHIDTTIGTPIKVNIQGDQMKIEYTDGVTDAALSNIMVVITP